MYQTFPKFWNSEYLFRNSEFRIRIEFDHGEFWVPARGTGNGVNGGTTCSSKFRIPNLYSTPRTAVQVPYSTVPYCTTVCTVQYRTVRYRTYTRQLLVLCTVVQVERYCTVQYCTANGATVLAAAARLYCSSTGVAPQTVQRYSTVQYSTVVSSFLKKTRCKHGITPASIPWYRHLYGKSK